MTESSHAVFLSYASEDAEAAQRIAEALRAAGIEVWFDKSELRGGDAWDRQIRRQIRDCALFVPLITANSQARPEGYFRLEWDLADQRTHLMGRNRAFIVPVCTDATPEREADVPDSFLAVQWTRLPGGETPSPFVERIKRLLSPESSPIPDRARSNGRAAAISAPGPRGLNRQTRMLYAAIAAAVVLALGYFGFERLNRSTPSVPGAASIAVLPLTNESGEASQQYFSDGISEDLITAFSQFPGLKVIGRTSAFQFRDSKEDSRSIGAKLGVAHLLEGSVRRSGEMVRVSAELIDTADGSTQWSERYDRPYKDLFALQDEITHAVAGALRTKLLPGESISPQSDRPPSGNLEAYNAVLEGKFYSRRDTEPDTRKAIDYFTRATQLDPRYPLAWSLRSQAWANLGANYLDPAPAEEAFSNGKAAADTALKLAPNLASAHIARGWLLQYADFDWHGAEAEYRRALELAPGDGEAKNRLGDVLATTGQIEKAIELSREALVTDPLRTTYYEQIAAYFWGLNRPDEAESAIRRAIELQPSAVHYHLTLTRIETVRGDARAALAAAQQESPGSFQDAALALASQIGNDRAAADAALKNLMDKYANFFPYALAQMYGIRSDPDATFKWLDKALSDRDPSIGYLLYDPFLARYKDDPRFAAFCRKVGLPTPAEVAAHKT